MSNSDIEAAFRAGFKLGFAASREGFNGECAYDHLAPKPAEVRSIAGEVGDEADAELLALEDAIWQRFISP